MKRTTQTKKFSSTGKNFANFRCSSRLVSRNPRSIIQASEPTAGALVATEEVEIRSVVVCEVLDRIFEYLVPREVLIPLLPNQALFSTQHVPMRRAVSGIISANAFVLIDQNDRKIGNPSKHKPAACNNVELCGIHRVDS
jgi:hypothetical protein